MKFRSLIALLLTCLWLTPAAFAVDNNENLKVGSDAPKLDIEHWISDGNGEFKKTTDFVDGKVYVVEFWATWCGPCIDSMPHLSEMQKKYANEGLQIISISDEDIDTVNSFLAKKVRGEEEMTYAKLTSTYCLTTDPDQSVYEDYMAASGQDGIPTAFVVGKKGQIEFIGHPMELEEPIEQILADKWDRDAFMKTQEERKEMMETLQSGMQQIGMKMQSGDTDGALEVIDGLIAENKDNLAGLQFKSIRVQILLQKGGEEATKAFAEFAEANQDDPQLLNEMAWTLVEMKMQGGGEVDDKLLAAGIKAIDWALKEASDDAMILDTKGHLLYLSGKLDEAIKVQTLAVENAGAAKGEIEPLLKKMLKEKEAAETKKEESKAQQTTNTDAENKESDKDK